MKRKRKINAVWTYDYSQDLKSLSSLDTQREITDILSKNIQQEIDDMLTNSMVDLAVGISIPILIFANPSVLSIIKEALANLNIRTINYKKCKNSYFIPPYIFSLASNVNDIEKLYTKFHRCLTYDIKGINKKLLDSHFEIEHYSIYEDISKLITNLELIIGAITKI